MRKNINLISLIAFSTTLTFIFSQQLSNANSVDSSLPSGINAGVYDAGSINSQAIQMINQRKTIEQEKEDLKKYQKERQQKNKEKEDATPEKKEEAIKTSIDYTIFITKVEFSPSKIFSSKELNEFGKELENKTISIKDIQKLVDKINNIYLEKGFVTARAFLTPQTIENGIIKIELVEGSVGQITVSENRWVRNSYITKRLTQKKGDTFDIVKLEQDVIKFNRYNDVIKLRANLTAGKENRTTDIHIQSQETFPFHITGLMDNAGRDTIGKLRGGVAVQADSLLGFTDKLSSGVYMSKSSVTPFVDYNIPVNKYDGRLGFMYSSSFSEITSGSFEMFKIEGRSHNYSLYYSHPLIRKPSFELTSISSANYKKATTAFDGNDLSTDNVSSLQTSLNAKYNTKKGIWYASQGVYQAIPLFGNDESKYFKYEGNLVRLHDLGHGIVGQFRTNYQYMPQDIVPYLDQFQSGGIATVRGYSEGLLIGKTGYFVSTEVIFPILPNYIKIKRNDKTRKIPFIGQWVKGAVFADHAGVFPYKGTGPGKEGINSNDLMVSSGLGLRISLPTDLTARLYWGFPIMRNNHESYQRTARFHFELALAPDFYRLIQLKHNRDRLKQETL